MSTRLLIGKDINGTICDTIGVAENLVRGASGAGVAVDIVVPPNVNAAFFAFGGAGDYWVNLAGTATVPSSPLESSSSELNPVSRYVKAGSTISLICSSINVYQVSFYSLEGG